jgi:hypothetical protein
MSSVDSLYSVTTEAPFVVKILCLQWTQVCVHDVFSSFSLSVSSYLLHRYHVTFYLVPFTQIPFRKELLTNFHKYAYSVL